MIFLLYVVMKTDGADVSAETMTKKISKADLIYVDGGNTFYLQRHIIESSFWNIANPFLEKGVSACRIYFHIALLFMVTVLLFYRTWYRCNKAVL
jgi:hypothetical protein